MACACMLAARTPQDSALVRKKLLLLPLPLPLLLPLPLPACCRAYDSLTCPPCVLILRAVWLRDSHDFARLPGRTLQVAHRVGTRGGDGPLGRRAALPHQYGAVVGGQWHPNADVLRATPDTKRRATC